MLGEQRRTPYELLGVAAVVALAGLLVARTSFFFADDFLFGSFFVKNELTSDLLLRSYFGHLVPATALFQSVFYNSVGLNWAAATAVMIVTLVGGAVAVTRLLDAVVGRRRICALAGAAFALSIGVLTLVGWWGAILGNFVPLVVCISFLGSLTRWDVGRRARHLVSAVLMYSFAVLFYEKSLLFSVYALLWTILVLDIDSPVRERVRRAIRRWPLWLPIGVVSAVVCYVYLSGDYRAEAGATPGKRLMLSFILRGIFGGLVPSVFGLDLQQPVWAGAVVPLAVMANVAGLAFVAWTIARAPRTAGVWAFVALVIFLGEIPLAVGRAGLVGVDGGRLLRYQIEGTLFVIIGATAALMQVHRARSTAKHGVDRAFPLRSVVAVSVVGLLGATAWWMSTTAYVRANPGTAARHWVDGFDAEWPRDRTVTMVDGPLPANIIFDWSYPYNLASFALPQLVDNVEFTTDPRGAWAMGPDGRVGPFAFQATGEWSVDRCVADGQPVLVSLDDPGVGQRQLLIDYRADGGGNVVIAVGVGEALGDTTGLSPVFAAHSGTGALVMGVRPGTAIDTVSVASDAPGFCLTSVTVGVVTGEG